MLLLASCYLMQWPQWTLCSRLQSEALCKALSIPAVSYRVKPVMWSVIRGLFSDCALAFAVTCLRILT